MGETQRDLTAVTSEYGDERSERGLGVSIRRGGIEVEYIDAPGIEERAPMAWTPDTAQMLLARRGYEVTGRWVDISDPCAEDPIWELPIATTADR
ncbi:hypothetical protein CH260_20320 [Rhodococcus sp. 05-2256-B2]|uniref:hypothetical protein n=1 Tax=unclassified Rhodococcus (in: high G+C Gram-positive bacteria) TaxID=192944 RepID=UPI000B9A19A9|nr:MULTISPECIES: hypothetical protein [unclassified Rhodococcus (in: high G+C Gram-positive bacteria)]OZD85293.1 hypothetical protein CH258_13850 [Rhodococcus sp. 05-2256-B4]OZD92439.1 hypothetical protein CH260_20320 [Rhodococcus sp. 05-2256-B2]OZD99335.1 hypothetical protein CH257_00780 [Rhodococcus sp. 05-2256-B3]OZE02859.1 hypothetical protein CH285_12895 [Rhodococcus sp. 05-2256-B1]